MDERAAASTLFGGTSTPPEDHSVGRAPDAKASRLFGETHPTAEGSTSWTGDVRLRELYGDDHVPDAKEMFSTELALKPAFEARVDDLMVVGQMGTAERQKLHRDFTATIRSSGLDPNTTGAQLFNLLVDATVADVHGKTLDDEQGRPMIEDVLSHVRAQMGPARGERLVKSVDAYIEANPRLKELLATPGLKARPQFRLVAEAILDHVRKQERI